MLKYSRAVPAYDEKHNPAAIKGCKLLFLKDIVNIKNLLLINFLEQDLNNVYTFQSDLAFMGQKKYILDMNDPQQYVLVVSSLLKQEVIENG